MIGDKCLQYFISGALLVSFIKVIFERRKNDEENNS